MTVLFRAARPVARVVFALTLLAPASLVAQGGLDSSAATPTRGLRGPAELEAFLDGFMATALRDKHVAGATVSVVKDGKLYFAKGYGYADWDKQVPVDPETTLFRIGSISKLFTWTAIMQLAEEGKVDLGADINTYLDFKIPDTYPEPITLRNVMTHTPGFEEDPRDLFTEDSAHVEPMGQWLPNHMPARVRPPGTFSSYSNYATAVAGYIVQRVSGLSWDDYMDQKILEPLGMTQATGRQPLPAALAPDMSEGYAWNGGRFQSHKWEFIVGAKPAGSFSASATAMAKFMIAHLNNGELNGTRILSDSTARVMHARLFGHDPRLNGFAYGFYEKSSHGLRIIGHGGDTQWFHSDLALIPSENVGVFVSFNTQTGGALSFGPFLTAFLDHYYPDPPKPIAPAADAKATAGRYAGEYVFNRRGYTTYFKAASLAGSLPVSVAEDGALLLGTPFGQMRLVKVDSLLFRDLTTGELVAFGKDQSGDIKELFLSAAPMMVGDKMSGLQSPKLHQFLLGLGFVMFFGILLAAVIRFFLRRSDGRPAPDRPIVTGRRLMVAAALAIIAFLLILVVAASSSPGFITSDPTFGLKALLGLPVLSLLFVLGALWVLVTQWRKSAGTVWMRLRHTLAVGMALIFFWSLNTWNLLGWRM